MAAYVIYQGEVLDPEAYERYKPLAAESIAAAGGRYLVRGGDIDVLEGEPPPGRTVVLEFPSMAAARSWFDDEGYREARAVRSAASVVRAYIVEGIGR